MISYDSSNHSEMDIKFFKLKNPIHIIIAKLKEKKTSYAIPNLIIQADEICKDKHKISFEFNNNVFKCLKSLDSVIIPKNTDDSWLNIYSRQCDLIGKNNSHHGKVLVSIDNKKIEKMFAISTKETVYFYNKENQQIAPDYIFYLQDAYMISDCINFGSEIFSRLTMQNSTQKITLFFVKIDSKNNNSEEEVWKNYINNTVKITRLLRNLLMGI